MGALVAAAALAAKEKWAALDGGRRLGATLYGGGGGTTCPSGYAWGGPGNYCISDNVYYCSSAGEYTSRITQNCGDAGCYVAPAGYADYCLSSGGGSGSRPPPPSGALNQFTKYSHYAVQGSNDRVIDYVYSPEDCAQRCLDERYFRCLSFEFASTRCVLSSQTHPTIYAYEWDLYLRDY
jgi:hypothetical protein